MSALPPHPWIPLPDVWVPFVDPMVDQAHTDIAQAVRILGFDYVNAKAYDWTQYARVDDKFDMARFAEAIQREARLFVEHEHIRRERERQAEIAHLRRRNSAAALLLDVD